MLINMQLLGVRCLFTADFIQDTNERAVQIEVILHCNEALQLWKHLLKCMQLPRGYLANSEKKVYF